MFLRGSVYQINIMETLFQHVRNPTPQRLFWLIEYSSRYFLCLFVTFCLLLGLWSVLERLKEVYKVGYRTSNRVKAR